MIALARHNAGAVHRGGASGSAVFCSGPDHAGIMMLIGSASEETETDMPAESYNETVTNGESDLMPAMTGAVCATPRSTVTVSVFDRPSAAITDEGTWRVTLLARTDGVIDNREPSCKTCAEPVTVLSDSSPIACLERLAARSCRPCPALTSALLSTSAAIVDAAVASDAEALHERSCWSDAMALPTTSMDWTEHVAVAVVRFLNRSPTRPTAVLAEVGEMSDGAPTVIWAALMLEQMKPVVSVAIALADTNASSRTPLICIASAVVSVPLLCCEATCAASLLTKSTTSAPCLRCSAEATRFRLEDHA
eukprot:403669-Rhodomonas_salina.1